MQPVPPALLTLSLRLRQLREQRWPDVRLTQAALAQALGGGKSLSAATVSSWESPIAPKLPPRDRILAYAAFFATRRSIEASAVLPLDDFTEEERTAYAELETELMGLRNAARKRSPGENVVVRRSWHFADDGPATLICAELPAAAQTIPLASPADPNYTELLSFADLDAMVELHGHIRAENPTMDVFYKASSKVVPDDLSSHMILLGGIGWNDMTKRLTEMTGLPVRQIEDSAVPSGEIFVATIDGRDHRFLPQWDHGQLLEDVGLLARVPNPLNSRYTLTICNGVHSRGVLGAVRSLTDAKLRDTNEQYIAENFSSSKSFIILMRVPVMQGQTMTPDFKNPYIVLKKWPEGGQK
jgi:hypothetical protein